MRQVFGRREGAKKPEETEHSGAQKVTIPQDVIDNCMAAGEAGVDQKVRDTWDGHLLGDRQKDGSSNPRSFGQRTPSEHPNPH